MKLPPQPLTKDEVARLIRAASSRCPTGLRNRALIVLLWRAGLRISEALALKPCDINLEEGTVSVLHGKNDKARVVGIDPQACAVLTLWLEQRNSLGMNGVHPLFCTLAGKPVQTAYVRALLPRLARRAGIEKRVHPHGLRHTHAVELAGEAVPLNIIQRQLGHSTPATTARYIDHIAPIEVIKAMRERSWE